MPPAAMILSNFDKFVDMIAERFEAIERRIDALERWRASKAPRPSRRSPVPFADRLLSFATAFAGRDNAGEATVRQVQQRFAFPNARAAAQAMEALCGEHPERYYIAMTRRSVKIVVRTPPLPTPPAAPPATPGA